MKKAFLILSTVVLLFGCKSQENNEQNEVENTIDHIITTNAKPGTSLDIIKKWEGKTAREAGLFNDSVLVQRLQDLLGKEYMYFQENWNVQTPITEEKNIYTASGCKQHDCASYNSVVYFDVKNNNINVLIKRGPQFKLFTEKGPMDLPKEMKKEQQVILQNG